MTIAHETQGGESYSISINDLKALMHEAREVEQRAERKFARMARGAAITDSKLGTVSGAGIGIVAGIGLIAGIIPGAHALASFSPALPVIGGAFCAAIGMLVGSFMDLHGVTDRD